MDNKTLTWQYIGIIACVAILLVTAVVCSFAFAVDNVGGVAQAYNPNSSTYTYTIDGDWTFDLSPNLQITQLNMLYYSTDIYSYLPDTFPNGIKKSEISIIGYSFYADLQVYNDIGDGGYDEFYLYDYPSLDSTLPELNDYIMGDEVGYTFDVDIISSNVSIAYQLYNRDSVITRNYYLEVSSITIIYSAQYFVIDRLVDEGYNVGYDDGLVDGYDDGYADGYDIGDTEGYDIGYDEGRDIGYDEGYDVGTADGYDVGYGAGYNNGYFDAGQDGVDYSWQGLISAVFDVPIRTLIGKWEDTNNDGKYELVGGLFNFYIPELDLNLAPILLSLITLCVIIVILKFVFQFL